MEMITSTCQSEKAPTFSVGECGIVVIVGMVIGGCVSIAFFLFNAHALGLIGVRSSSIAGKLSKEKRLYTYYGHLPL